MLTLQVSRHAVLGSWGRVNTGLPCSQGSSGADTFLTYTPVTGHTGTFTDLKQGLQASQGPPEELPGVLLENCILFQEDSVLPTAPVKEEARQKMPGLPLSWQAAARGKG